MSRALVVALEAEHGRAARVGGGGHVRLDVGQRVAPVDLGAALAQQVQVGAVHEQQQGGVRRAHEARRSLRARASAFSPTSRQASPVTSACRARLTCV